MLWLHLRRFECPECLHRPWETSKTFGERTKWTQRLYHQVRTECLRRCPGDELARRYGLSARTVFRWTFERSRGGRPRKLGRAIGIDEYARRKGHHYDTLIVDLEQGQPIATLKGRRADDVITWFKSRPPDEITKVEVVVLDSRWREIRACNDNACGESTSKNSHDSLLDLTFLIVATDPKGPIY